MGTNVKEVESRIEELHEQNPMLGHRGCRLGISFPEIYEIIWNVLTGQNWMPRKSFEPGFCSYKFKYDIMFFDSSEFQNMRVFVI